MRSAALSHPLAMPNAKTTMTPELTIGGKSDALMATPTSELTPLLEMAFATTTPEATAIKQPPTRPFVCPRPAISAVGIGFSPYATAKGP